jgi:hypothetical protein
MVPDAVYKFEIICFKTNLNYRAEKKCRMNIHTLVKLNAPRCLVVGGGRGHKKKALLVRFFFKLI